MSKTFFILVIIFYKTVKMSALFLVKLFLEVVVLNIITLIYFLKIPYFCWSFKKVSSYNLSFFSKIAIRLVLVIRLICTLLPLAFLHHNWRDYVKLYGFFLDHTIYAAPVSSFFCLLVISSLYFIYQKIKNKKLVKSFGKLIGLMFQGLVVRFHLLT